MPDVPPDIVDAGCPPGTKYCGGCVAMDVPLVGCGSNSCLPCSLQHATATCSAGVCAVGACDTGWADCNGTAADGCETSLGTADNCGACGTKCVYAHANPTCSTGACQLGTCQSGWGDCNSAPSDGCERSLTTLTDCGQCGVACNLAHGLESCSTGACHLVACSSGYGNCDTDEANGCELLLNALPNCGACGQTCVGLPHATSAGCLSAKCHVNACEPYWGDCDGAGTNGCETDLLSDSSSCSACGNACTPSSPHHTVSCVNGACVTGGCETGYLDCDGDSSNGCEAFAYSNAAHCGTCVKACAPGEMCAAGQCVTSCAQAGLNCTVSSVSPCVSSFTAFGQYNGGDRIVCIERGLMTPFDLALLSYEPAAWTLTGAVSRLKAVQVYSYDPGTTCVGAGSAPLGIQIAGSTPADPYAYGATMSECTTHTGYAAAVFGAQQSQVCDLNCNGPGSYTCLSIAP